MTLTIELPPEAEIWLQQESERTGTPVNELAGQLLTERLKPGQDRISKLAHDIGAPIDLADASREAIYAE